MYDIDPTYKNPIPCPCDTCKEDTCKQKPKESYCEDWVKYTKFSFITLYRRGVMFVTEKELFKYAEIIKLYCSYVKDCEELCFFHKQYNECPFGRDIQPWLDWKIERIVLQD